MSQLIWIAYFIGLLVAFVFWGSTGRMVYAVAVGLAILLFRRPLTLALTHLSAKLGLIRETIDRMPPEIHLVRAGWPAEAARGILDALAGCRFADAGAWSIRELPKIQVSLAVRPDDGLFAAVESASPIGAQVNVHTLYPDGRVFTVTNSELPAPRVLRPDVTREQYPRCDPAELVRKALARRPGAGFRPIAAEEAPRLYERLYAEEIRFRKARGR
jgi:hypothetical protein